MQESAEPTTEDEPTIMGLPVSQAGLEPQETRDGRVARLLPEWVNVVEPPPPGSGRVSMSESPKSALPALTVRRGNKGIGRYLKDSKVLVLNNESDRGEALAALEQAGLDVLRPLSKSNPEDIVFHGQAKPIGAWGNVIGFYGEVRTRSINALVALVNLDTRELFTISDVLVPPVLARLVRMGVAVDVVHPAAPSTKLAAKMSWFTQSWDTSFEEEDPRLTVPADITFKMDADLAAELPAEIVAAFEEQLATSAFDPLPKRSQGAYWEKTNGVLDSEDIATFRKLAPRGVEMPEDWDIIWEMAVELSEPHAPVLCALYLHDLHPEWWDALPLTEYVQGGTWLLGHSMSQPYWFRQDMNLDAERRLQCAVALVIEAVGDVKGLRKLSRQETPCAACGRPFERGLLQAGEIYQRATARVCGRCVNVSWPQNERDLTPVQREGLLANLRAYVDAAGGVISSQMIYGVSFPFDMPAEAKFILERELPWYVTNNWIEWLGNAGVLGEGTWRPSYGQISTASDGHLCRSFLERVIDDFFSASGITHEPEPLYPYDVDLNPNGLRGDWELADGTLVEAAGLMSDPVYAAKVETKRKVATKHGLRLIVLEEPDLVGLREIFDAFVPDLENAEEAWEEL